jgi:hypothetical protein
MSSTTRPPRNARVARPHVPKATPTPGSWIIETGGGGGGGGTGGGGVPAPDVSIDPPAEVIFRSDHQVEVDVAWIAAATATAANFLGVAIYLEDPDISTGANHPLDGLSMPLDGSAQVSGEWAPALYGESTKSPAVLLLDSPQNYKTARNIRIYLAAYGPYSHAHPVRATDPNPTPNILVEIPIGRGSGESGMEWAFLVTLPDDAVTVVTDYNRVDPKYYLVLKYTPPDPSIPVPPGVNHFGGCRIVFVYLNDSGGPIFPGTDTGMNIPVNQSDTGFKTDAYTFGSTGKFRVYFVSEDDSQPLGAHMNSLTEGTTPFAEAIIPAVPTTPNVSDFAISNQKIIWLLDGSMIAQATFSWHLPDTAAGNIRYAGVHLYLVSVSGTGATLTPFPQDLTGPHSNVETNYILEISNVPGTVEHWIIAAISYDNNGKLADGQDPKNYGKPGFTSPTVTWDIGPPSPGQAGSGEEFAPVVTLGPGASASDSQSLSSDGVNMVSFAVGPWINPTANQFGSAQIAMVVNGNFSRPTFYTVPANATSFQTPPIPSFGNINSPVAVDFYVVSDDPQGNKNQVVQGKTPKIPFTYTPKSGAIIPARSGWFDDTQFSWVDGAGLTADNIEANNIYVGKTLVVGGSNDTSFAGQSNGQIAVKNSSGTLRAWMGEQQPGQGTQAGVAPLWGAWFGQMWVGGTSPLDAPLWVDNQGIIQVGGIAAKQGSRYPYLSVRDQTGLEMGRIGAQLTAPSGSIGDNVGPNPPNQLTAGAWFAQLAIGGSNLSNWNILITPDTSKPLGSLFQMRNIYSLSIDYASQIGPPSNPEYKLEFGNSVWSTAGGPKQWQFPGIHIYEVDNVQNLFGAVYLNRGMVLRGKQTQGYNVIASLVTYNGNASGADDPGDFWGELTLYSPNYPYRPTVSLSSGSAANGSAQFTLLEENGGVLFQVGTNGNAYFKGPIQGLLLPSGASTPVNAIGYNVGGYPGKPAKPVIDADGNWVGNTIPAPPPIGQSPWTTDIQASGHSLSGVETISSNHYARKDGTIVINVNGAFVGAGVAVLANGIGCGGINTRGDGSAPSAADTVDTGTVNCRGTVTCNTFVSNSFNPYSISTASDINAGGFFTGGQFKGSGVWCPDFGIRCGSLTASDSNNVGGAIACGNLAAVDWVNCMRLQIQGIDRIDHFGIYRGSTQWNDHCYMGDFGIYNVVVGWDGTFYDRDGKAHTVRGGIITT